MRVAAEAVARLKKNAPMKIGAFFCAIFKKTVIAGVLGPVTRLSHLLTLSRMAKRLPGARVAPRAR
jgi:hypothetical protein